MNTFLASTDKRVVELPDGCSMKLPEEVLLALSFFVGAGKPAGSVTITFKNGNVAGVDTSTKTVLK